MTRAEAETDCAETLHTEADGALMSGGHLVVDLLNTVYRVKGVLVDTWQSDEDVVRWLERAGWPLDTVYPATPASHLLKTARSLREAVRAGFEQVKTARVPT